MSKYLLTCDCGSAVPVEVGQAGEQVACQCGAVLEVPPLRKLRHLPTAAAEPPPRTSTWNLRWGIIAACLIPATVLAAWALWSRLTEPYVAPFDPAIRQQIVDQGLEKLTPVESWQLWIDRYQPLARHGFAELEHPHAAAIAAYVARQRFLQKSLLAVAGVFAGVAVIAALWPRAHTTGQRRSAG